METDGGPRYLLPPAGASQAERDLFYKGLKRKGRQAAGRCPYCGGLPEAGRVRCARCLALQRAQGARMRARQRDVREAALRAALPRRCAGCGGADLSKAGFVSGRQYYRCRGCGRSSNGDGPAPPPPHYPCPYCGARCKKRGRVVRFGDAAQRYECVVCGRSNTNLWPGDTPSPGGPFPHTMRFGLNVPAHQALLVYCQEKQMSVAQAIRDIFIRAAAAPPMRSVATRTGGTSQSPMLRAYLDARPALPLPIIPPGGIRLPSAYPAALEKLKRHYSGGRFNPSVLATLTVSVRLSDLALASLMEMMRRRGLNHQDTARALIAETQQAPRVASVSVGRASDLEDGW